VLPRSQGGTPGYGQHAFTEDERRNRWLVVAGGEPGVPAPVVLRQDATVRVARLEAASLSYTFDPARYGFLFVADGEAVANGERLATGDAVRMTGVRDLEVRGSAELVLWMFRPPTSGWRMHETGSVQSRQDYKESGAADARRLRGVSALR